MCGHFALDAVNYDTREQLGADYGSYKLAASPHIRPTDSISLLRAAEGALEVVALPWGLKTDFSPRPVINARVETLSERPLFKPALGVRQAVVPASAWFEWRREGSDKVGYRFDGERLLHFAALWWPASERHPRGAVVLVTTAATPPLEAYHHRMPLCLGRDQVLPWLAGQAPEAPFEPTLSIGPKDPHRPVQPDLF
ncbi:SOS response-associated peptidase [Ferrimonas balearica]|uniref:SOS response-associated peptidase n=1 Tax=Ferrimonas balearica TaxID=44012 RepID=UPI001C9999CD|nr:SOS response-associated peptidase family protein [Ferrimonas balearica]MBY5992630.1 SOS response-associated peptidase [Ferrimonas balearica]